MTHDFMNYDVSLLSSTPIIIHIHPLDVEPHMRAQPGDDAPDAFFDKLGKYFSAILSRKDCSVLHKFSFDTRNEMSLSAGIVCSV